MLFQFINIRKKKNIKNGFRRIYAIILSLNQISNILFIVAIDLLSFQKMSSR